MLLTFGRLSIKSCLPNLANWLPASLVRQPLVLNPMWLVWVKFHPNQSREKVIWWTWDRVFVVLPLKPKPGISAELKFYGLLHMVSEIDNSAIFCDNIHTSGQTQENLCTKIQVDSFRKFWVETCKAIAPCACSDLKIQSHSSKYAHVPCFELAAVKLLEISRVLINIPHTTLFKSYVKQRVIFSMLTDEEN